MPIYIYISFYFTEDRCRDIFSEYGYEQIYFPNITVFCTCIARSITAYPNLVSPKAVLLLAVLTLPLCL